MKGWIIKSLCESTKGTSGASLVAQWLKNPPAKAKDMGSIPDPGRSHLPQSN